MPGEQLDEQGIIQKYFPESLRDRRTLERAIQQRLALEFGPLVEPTIPLVRNLLNQMPVQPEERERFFYRLDDANKLKRVDSIIAKICRLIDREKRQRQAEWRHRTDPNDFLDYFLCERFADVARFRIVCNYIGDARRIGGFLREHEALRSQFPAYDPRRDYEDKIDDEQLREKARGHRAIHLVLTKLREDGKPLRVEVQIMTLLQEVWDKKDHPIYERRRIGADIDAPTRIKMRALSDMLYVADEFVDSVWQEVLEKERQRT